MIKIDHISKSFKDVLILNDISVSIDKSDIVGLAGPSGGGKSTLLRCIQSLETIDAGTIKCNGTTGFMFQDFQLFPHMTVLRNLTYAPTLRDKTQDLIDTAKSMLKNLGIQNKIYEYPHNLSGGQKQRVALARSLMMRPDILLCDEPTSGLDVATTSDVVSLLRSVRDMGVTMVIASHDLDFLTQVADRVILLKNGKIVIDITPGENVVSLLKDYY